MKVRGPESTATAQQRDEEGKEMTTTDKPSAFPAPHYCRREILGAQHLLGGKSLSPTIPRDHLGLKGKGCLFMKMIW